MRFDIAGLVKGASKGEGLGNQFLSNIREVDATPAPPHPQPPESLQVFRSPNAP